MEAAHPRLVLADEGRDAPAAGKLTVLRFDEINEAVPQGVGGDHCTTARRTGRGEAKAPAADAAAGAFTSPWRDEVPLETTTSRAKS